MYYLYGKLNRGHGIGPLYGGCPLLGESVIRGFTVYGEFQIYCNDPEVRFGSPDVQVQCRIVYSTDCSFRL